MIEVNGLGPRLVAGRPFEGAERIRQPGRRRPGPERLLLRGVRAPTAHVNHLESRAHPPVAKAGEIPVGRNHALERPPPERRPAPAHQRVGLGHGAEIGQKPPRGFISNGKDIVVDDRQREAGALEERPGIGDPGERRDVGGDAALLGEVGGEKRLAELGQGVAAKPRRQQQPVGPEQAADLNERAGEVVGGMKKEGREDEIEAIAGEGEKLLIGDDQRGTGSVLPGEAEHRAREVGRDQAIDPAAGECGHGQAAVAGAEVEREREAAVDVGQAIAEAERDLGEQEAGAAQAGGAVAGAPDGNPIEDERRVGSASHDRRYIAQAVPPSHRSSGGRAIACRVGRALKSAARLALDQLLPPRCLGCGEAVDAAGRICVACFQALAFLTPPLCAGCGLPLPAVTGTHCGACLAAPPPYNRARAALGYNAASRRMLLAFKHGDRTEAARTFAAWMRAAAPDLVAEAHWVVPVPLHRWRLFARRYNQAALLTYALVGRGRVLPDALVRVRPTPSQGSLSRAARARNVAGAFRVRRAARQRLAGAHVLLVDDVMTTGATLEACARALRRAGAAQVDALTVARVVRDGGEVI